MSCGTGECGCGCEDLPIVQIKVKEREEHLEHEMATVVVPNECCEPICAPSSCQ